MDKKPFELRDEPSSDDPVSDIEHTEATMTPSANKSGGQSYSVEDAHQSQNIPSSSATVMSAESQPRAQAKKTKLGVLVGVIVILLLGSGLTAWYMTNNNSNQPEESQDQTNTVVQPAEPLKPYAAVYSTTSVGEVNEKTDCATIKTTVHIKPFNNDQAYTFEPSDNLTLSWFDTYENKIALVTEPSCGSKEKMTVWLSKDSGRSFEKIFEGNNSTNEGFGDQATSLKFARDGTSVVVAVLPGEEGSPKNTVKQIDIDSKSVTNLLSTDEAGVFIEGFDNKDGKIYYFTGCYNCDGNTNSKLMVHDVADGSKKVVFDIGDKVTSDSQINPNYSKILVVKSQPAPDTLGSIGPYELVEIDLNSGEELSLKTSKDSFASIGYRGTIPYYALKNKIFVIENEKETALFETENSLANVYVLSNDAVIGSTASGDSENLFSYAYETKSLTSLTKITSGTALGITWK